MWHSAGVGSALKMPAHAASALADQSARTTIRDNRRGRPRLAEVSA